MCAPTVNYAQQNYGIATEKLAFDCDKSFSGAGTNLHQQNPCMTSGIIFVTIPYGTIYYILLFTIYTIFTIFIYSMCLYVKYCKVLLDFT